MTQLYRLLYAHLSTLGFPLYAADQVPHDAAFPYLTFEAVLPGDLQGTGTLTLRAWCRSDAPHSERLRLGDMLMACVPLSGLPLWSGDALTVCWRQESGAASLLREHDACAVQVQHMLRRYPNAT